MFTRSLFLATTTTVPTEMSRGVEDLVIRAMEVADQDPEAQVEEDMAADLVVEVTGAAVVVGAVATEEVVTAEQSEMLHSPSTRRSTALSRSVSWR